MPQPLSLETACRVDGNAGEQGTHRFVFGGDLSDGGSRLHEVAALDQWEGRPMAAARASVVAGWAARRGGGLFGGAERELKWSRSKGTGGGGGWLGRAGTSIPGSLPIGQGVEAG